MRTIHAALAAFILAAAQPAFAETLHIRGVPVPPIQTVEQARAETEKRLATIQAREAEEAKVAAQVTSSPSAITDSPLFFTGKPLIEETGQYAFLFRHYDPELNRWTTSDPSGFPDGANNVAYMAVPTSQFDWQGLETVKVGEWYGLSLDDTLSYVELAMAASAGALTSWGSDVDPVSAGLVGASAYFAYTWAKFQGSVLMRYSVGDTRIVGSLYSTDYAEFSSPRLVSGPHDEITSIEFTWEAKSAGFLFSAFVDSNRHWIYE